MKFNNTQAQILAAIAASPLSPYAYLIGSVRGCPGDKQFRDSSDIDVVVVLDGIENHAPLKQEATRLMKTCEIGTPGYGAFDIWVSRKKHVEVRNDLGTAWEPSQLNHRTLMTGAVEFEAWYATHKDEVETALTS